MASAPYILLTPAALAAAKKQGLDLAALTSAEVAELNQLNTPATLALEQGIRAATAVRNAQEIAALVKSRPAPNSQPDVIAAWLKQDALSPVDWFPEFGWTHNVDGSASASYDLGQGDHIAWTSDASKTWGYHHTWGGVDIGRTLESIAGTLSTFAIATGWAPVGLLIQVGLAAAEHQPLSNLGQALKNDYETIAKELDLETQTMGLIFGEEGDVSAWEHEWDLATQYGQDLEGIEAAWSPAPPPGRDGNILTATTTLKAPAAPAAPSALSSAIAQNDATASAKLQNLLSKGNTMAGFDLVLVQPKAGETAAQATAQSQALTAAMNAVKTQSAAQLAGAKAVTPTAANPQGGRTILGLPALDVGIGAVAAVGLAIVAKVKHWF